MLVVVRSILDASLQLSVHVGAPAGVCSNTGRNVTQQGLFFYARVRFFFYFSTSSRIILSAVVSVLQKYVFLCCNILTAVKFRRWCMFTYVERMILLCCAGCFPLLALVNCGSMMTHCGTAAGYDTTQQRWWPLVLHYGNSNIAMPLRCIKANVTRIGGVLLYMFLV